MMAAKSTVRLTPRKHGCRCDVGIIEDPGEWGKQAGERRSTSPYDRVWKQKKGRANVPCNPPLSVSYLFSFQRSL